MKLMALQGTYRLLNYTASDKNFPFLPKTKFYMEIRHMVKLVGVKGTHHIYTVHIYGEITK